MKKSVQNKRRVSRRNPVKHRKTVKRRNPVNHRKSVKHRKNVKHRKSVKRRSFIKRRRPVKRRKSVKINNIKGGTLPKRGSDELYGGEQSAFDGGEQSAFDGEEQSALDRGKRARHTDPAAAATGAGFAAGPAPPAPPAPPGFAPGPAHPGTALTPFAAALAPPGFAPAAALAPPDGAPAATGAGPGGGGFAWFTGASAGHNVGRTIDQADATPDPATPDPATPDPAAAAGSGGGMDEEDAAVSGGGGTYGAGFAAGPALAAGSGGGGTYGAGFAAVESAPPHPGAAEIYNPFGAAEISHPIGAAEIYNPFGAAEISHPIGTAVESALDAATAAASGDAAVGPSIISQLFDKSKHKGPSFTKHRGDEESDSDDEGEDSDDERIVPGHSDEYPAIDDGHRDPLFDELIEQITSGSRSNDCSEHTLLHAIDKNINMLDAEIGKMETSYLSMITQKVYDVFVGTLSEKQMYTQERKYTEEENVWYENFKGIYGGFQRYNEYDLKQGIKRLIDSYDISGKGGYGGLDLTGAPTPIKTLFETYRHKIATSLFTKGSISYAIFLYDTIYKFTGSPPLPLPPPPPYVYLGNLLSIIRIAISNINSELVGNWKAYVSSKYDGSEYVLSGGSIFILFAGVLCYINTYNYPRADGGIHLLEELHKQVSDELGPEEYLKFKRDLGMLFRDPSFIKNVKTILSGASDLDFIFMGKTDRFVKFTNNTTGQQPPHPGKQISNLSAKVLHSLLDNTHSGKGIDNAIRKNVHSLFPFFDLYDSSFWNKGRLYDTAQMDITLKRIILADIGKCTGMRQTSTFVRELPIYLNRIKQGYYPLFFNGDGGILKDRPIKVIDEYKEKYKTTYGEGIDLVVGSRKSPLFKGKHNYYKSGNYYTIKNFAHELRLILSGEIPDDKTSKRMARQAFLNKLTDSPCKGTYDGILRKIGIMIHSYYEL